jgi:glycosyltransferase involved in cell wall biosynthesis
MTKPCGAPPARPRALFLTPEAPFPIQGGGALRTASLLEFVARRYDTDVVVFREPGAPDPGPRFPAGLVCRVQVIDLPVHKKHLIARALRNTGRLVRRRPPLLDRFGGFAHHLESVIAGRHYDCCVIEHFWCAPYVEQLRKCCDRVILDLHNIESVLHARCAMVEPWPIATAHKVFEQACSDLERQLLPRFSMLLAASEADAATLQRIAPTAQTTVFPNTLPPLPLPSVPEREIVVFSGNLEYHPNVSAVRFFRYHVWPLLRERYPRLGWRVVGKNPRAVARYLAGDERIEVSGPVDDAVTEIARARVAVAPLLAGSGTRMKILEAWAAGRAVVSTPIGAEGLPARDRQNMLLASGAADFAAAVSALLDDDLLRRRIGAAGRLEYEQNFTWASAWARIDGKI